MLSRVKPWLLLALIFGVGMVTGASLAIALRSHFDHPPGGPQIRTHWMMHLTQRLNLTPDQQAKIQPILADAEQQILSVHRDEVGRVAQIIDQTNTQIAGILTPEQQVQLQQLGKEMDMYRDRMFPGDHSHHHWGGPDLHGGPPGVPGGATNSPPSGTPPPQT